MVRRGFWMRDLYETMSLSEFARMTGKVRQTLYRYIERGDYAGYFTATPPYRIRYIDALRIQYLGLTTRHLNLDDVYLLTSILIDEHMNLKLIVHRLMLFLRHQFAHLRIDEVLYETGLEWMETIIQKYHIEPSETLRKHIELLCDSEKPTWQSFFEIARACESRVTVSFDLAMMSIERIAMNRDSALELELKNYVKDILHVHLPIEV